MWRGIWCVSRSWLLYLDDLIGSAEKIGRLTSGRTVQQFVSDEAAFDAALFNLQVPGEAIKKLPAEARTLLLRPALWPARRRSSRPHGRCVSNASTSRSSVGNCVCTVLHTSAWSTRS